MSEIEKRLGELEERLRMVEATLQLMLADEAEDEMDLFELEHRQFVAKAKAHQERGH